MHLPPRPKRLKWPGISRTRSTRSFGSTIARSRWSRMALSEPAPRPTKLRHREITFITTARITFTFRCGSPIELGHQTRHRYHIAQAAYDQQKWLVVQAELTALVQTYRFFQTAAYRREKFRLAQDLAEFNDRLQETLDRRLEANQVQAADVALGRVESRATRQQVKAARQDYLTALTDLRNQIGIPEQAGAFEPLGEFSIPPYIPPVDEQVMVQEAINQRPDIKAAHALVAGTHSAIDLARGDQIPTPIIGPEYQMDEAGVQYVGFVFIAPIPIWNNGRPLVLQREAEHRRAIVALKEAQQRAVAQVRAAVAKWNGATELVNDSAGLSRDLSVEVNKMERLFEDGQADLTKLMQARQRLIQLENSRLDAVWQATQAQADLLLALGIPSMINGMINQAGRRDATPDAGQNHRHRDLAFVCRTLPSRQCSSRRGRRTALTTWSSTVVVSIADQSRLLQYL